MDLEEGVCAGCGKPLGARANWRTANEGRAYHNDCPIPELPSEPPLLPDRPPPPPPEPPTSLTEFTERKAREAIHGRGTKTLHEDATEHGEGDA
jgi:hypothetical protein